MGMSLNVAFKKKVNPYGKLGADHPVVADTLERLDKLAAKHDLTALSEFHSIDPEEAAEMLDMDPEEIGLAPLQWFDPKDGLAAVEGLINLLGQSPKLVAKGPQVLAELQSIKQELLAAQKQKAQFHLALLD